MKTETAVARIDLWFCILTQRGCRTYHRTLSRESMLDELKRKLACRKNLWWFEVDCADIDTVRVWA